MPLARPGPDQACRGPGSATSPVADPSHTGARPGRGQVADINHVIDFIRKTKN
jgi:hypothetical protein